MAPERMSEHGLATSRPAYFGAVHRHDQFGRQHPRLMRGEVEHTAWRLQGERHAVTTLAIFLQADFQCVAGFQFDHVGVSLRCLCKVYSRVHASLPWCRTARKTALNQAGLTV